MPLTPGARLGPYELIAPIGAGGMGEVYTARDTKLDRVVALKVLPQLFTGDPERLARFEREAKVLASLNHSNIAQVYGFDAGAIAMEFVDGQTLQELIDAAAGEQKPGGLPLDRALAIARQIASALEAAHDQGIVHRDLKPANVKVREDGTVKVLDFGLAKAFAADAESAASGVSNSPTLTARATQLGMILGTAAYMAPEQAKGRSVDRRADVWAFGVVLFEMLAGRRAFEGDDVSEVLAAVLKTEPDWGALPADLPAPVLRLLKRCLEKDPKRRLRDVAEGMLQLDEGLAAGASPGSTRSETAVRVAPPAPLWRRLLPIALTAIATAAIVVGVDEWRTPAPVQKTPIRFAFEPPAQTSLYVSVAAQDVSISPDGGTIVYSGSDGTREPKLFVRRLDQFETAPLRGGERGLNPVVSPDSAWVAFVDQVDQTQLKRVSMLGGPAVPLAKMKRLIGGVTWTRDGLIILGANVGPLMVLPEGGGEAKSLTTLDAGESEHIWPSAVPGTSVVLFTVGVGTLSPATGGQLAAIDRATGRTVRFKIAGFHPRFVPPASMVFASADGSLRAVHFDPKTMAVSGNPVPVLEGVGVKASGSAEFDVANDGRLIYATGGSGLGSTRTLAWVDRTGKDTPIAAETRTYFYARLSPDGSRLSADVRDQEQNVWIWDFARETLLRLTDKPGTFQYCLWTPDSQRVVFASVGERADNLFQMRADGTGAMEAVTDFKDDKIVPFPNAITSDGKQVIFRASTNTQNDLYLASLTGDHAVRKLLATDHDELNATLSPDDKWMAFQSDLSGHFEVYVRPFPNVDAGQFPISTGGGVKPAWSPTGREIFYVSPDNRLMSVPVDTTHGFSPGKPVPLFDGAAYFLGGVGRNYDVSRDGKRFVFPKTPPAAPGHTQSITVVVDWADELRARVK